MSRILHTADWHLGARLIEHSRHDEHGRFLDWLLEQIREITPRLLIVAGDIFDSANPPQQALAQYYEFLAAVSRTETEVLILGGNHDSAAILNAPRDLLRSLRIRVVGSAPENPADALLDIGDAVICAVPFLRERDVRRASSGQSFDEVAAQIRTGILQHYRTLYDHARDLAAGRPILATGHLTALGVTGSDSERAIHIGNLGAVPVECFADFTYVALGHIHRPQTVGGSAHIRYAGSPIALGFDEAANPKQILLITTATADFLEIQPIAVPLSRRLLRLECLTSGLAETLHKIIFIPDQLPPWIELTVLDGHAHPDLDEKVRIAQNGLPFVILKLIAPPLASEMDPAQAPFQGRALAEIRPGEVFAEKLHRAGIEGDEAAELTGTFDELLSKMQEAAA